jgi:predicted AlkP superfamily phosphohydrolase/phosphomutase
MKSILVGFDAFDPGFFERLSEGGKLPNLTKFMGDGAYARFNVSNPPQSEVSWTSIATGLNPGSHGVFDFVHRNPETYALHVSLLPTKKGLAGVQFTRPYDARTIFDHAVERGYPATSLWWPATFPARLESPVASIPGLGTPDVLGRLGAGVFFSPHTDLPQDEYKTRIEFLEERGAGRYHGQLIGPSYKKRSKTVQAAVDVSLELLDDGDARLVLGGQKVELTEGEWSPILEITFRVKLGVAVHAITRAIFRELRGRPGLYLLPLQIHPLHPSWPYAAPRGLAKSAWKDVGPFLTLGWPQDTTGLEEGFIDDSQFMTLCESILKVRERIFIQQIRKFREGILAGVFDSLDRVQHMFWKDRQDIIESWYEKLDALFGRIQAEIQTSDKGDARMLVVSDHGFTAFDYKVHLNRWLIDAGLLTPTEGAERADLQNVNWSQTQAYALGLNSLYLNLSGREGRGAVDVSNVPELTERLIQDVKNWRGPDGRKAVNQIWKREEALHGPLAIHGPDLIVGYNSGYRASAETGLGSWEDQAIIPNEDHWGADHCIDPDLVPGVLFADAGLKDLGSPSYEDIPEMITGTSFDPDRSSSSQPPVFNDEDQEVLEERLKDLGYL